MLQLVVFYRVFWTKIKSNKLPGARWSTRVMESCLNRMFGRPFFLKISPCILAALCKRKHLICHEILKDSSVQGYTRLLQSLGPRSITAFGWMGHWQICQVRCVWAGWVAVYVLEVAFGFDNTQISLTQRSPHVNQSAGKQLPRLTPTAPTAPATAPMATWLTV